MRRIALAGLLMTCMPGIVLAQIDVAKLITGNQGSPEAITSIHYGREGKLIWIFYHAPSVKGRHIFNGAGALQPDGTVWRLGADDATVLHTDADLDIGGLAVPKGEYTLYVDLDKGNWKLVVNKQLTDRRGRPQWGINMDGSTSNSPATELGRVAMTMGKPASPVETLRIALMRTEPPTESATHGKLEIAWENVTASVPFTVK
ncbi:MAG TPA: DUF2911 domain-containing protein [Verrucomicrobiae bacterium]|nr:DUF2911 domain-containing protein [Verrucomicrobiae bacterium]